MLARVPANAPKPSGLRRVLRWTRRLILLFCGIIALLDFPTNPVRGIDIYRAYENGLYTPPSATTAATWSTDVANATPVTRLVRTETLVRRQRYGLFTLEHRSLRIVWDPKSGTPLAGEHEDFIRRVVASHVPRVVFGHESSLLARLSGTLIESPLQRPARDVPTSLARVPSQTLLCLDDTLWLLAALAFYGWCIAGIVNTWRSRRRDARWLDYRCEQCGFPDPNTGTGVCPECGHQNHYG